MKMGNLKYKKQQHILYNKIKKTQVYKLIKLLKYLRFFEIEDIID